MSILFAFLFFSPGFFAVLAVILNIRHEQKKEDLEKAKLKNH